MADFSFRKFLNEMPEQILKNLTKNLDTLQTEKKYEAVNYKDN